MRGLSSCGAVILLVLVEFLVAPFPAHGARRLGSPKNSAFGQDSDTASWLISSSSTQVQGVTINVMVVCPGLDLADGACGPGLYEVLVQIPQGPDDLSMTFSGLSGYDIDNFGVKSCPDFAPLQTSIALCTPNPSGDLQADYTPIDGSSFTLTFGSPNSFFPTGGLTFYLDNLTSDPTGQVGVMVSGHAGVSLSQTSLQFGSQPVPTTVASSVMQTAILTNGGLTPLNVSSVAAGGPFAVASDCITASPLAQGAFCSIGVTFQPTGAASGRQTGTVTISDDAPSGQQVINLSGYPDNSSLAVAPATLVFGTQPVMTSDDLTIDPSNPQTVVLTNHGSTDLSLTDIFVGDGSGNECGAGDQPLCDFQIQLTSTCTNSTVLAAQDSCTLDISSIANFLGPNMEEIEIHDGDSVTHHVALSGFGGTPTVDFDFAHLSFTSAGDEQSTTLSKGTLPIPLMLGNFAASGGFTLAPPPSACNDSVTSCSLSMTFTPALPGLQTGMLTMTDNVANGVEVVSMSGTGELPAVSLSTTEVTLPDTPVGATSSPQTITLTNSGNQPLQISDLSPTSGFTVDGATTTCSTISPLDAGSPCTIGVTFTPSAAGLATGTLVITDNAGTSPQSVSLSGTGLAPVVSLSPPTSLDFGDQPLGVTSEAQSVTVTNTGTANLTFTAITPSGDFAVAPNGTTCSTATPVLPGNHSCVVKLTFTPTALGIRSGALTLTDNAADSPHTVSLTGTGTAPAVSLSASGLSFGNQALNAASAAQTVTVTNTGTGDLNITTASISGTNSGDFAKSADSCSGAAVTPNHTCTVSVKFTPSALGDRSASLKFTDNAADSPQTVSLTGTGTAPAVSLSASGLSFGNQALNAASAAQTVTVTNTGTGDLNITTASISGTNSGDFAKSADSCSGAAVTPNHTCTVSVKFTPSVLGDRSASLKFTDNAADSPQSISLSGTGTGPAVSLSANSLTFSGQLTGTSSDPQTVTLNNTGSDALSVSDITVTGDFAQTNTCGSSVSAGGNCTITVTFNPAAVGNRTGTLSIADNAAHSPQSVTLSGTGEDFSFAPPSGSSTSATVSPGQGKTFMLSVGGQGGLSGTVSFTCTGAPSEATCTVSPNPLTVGSSAAPVTVTVTTTAPTLGAPRSRPLPPAPSRIPGIEVWLMLALALAAMAGTSFRQRQNAIVPWRFRMLPLAAGLALTLALAGCGGGGGGGGGGTFHDPGTPSGTYTLTVTGTAGSGAATRSHSVTLTLKVS